MTVLDDQVGQLRNRPLFVEEDRHVALEVRADLGAQALGRGLVKGTDEQRVELEVRGQRIGRTLDEEDHVVVMQDHLAPDRWAGMERPGPGTRRP